MLSKRLSQISSIILVRSNLYRPSRYVFSSEKPSNNKDQDPVNQQKSRIHMFDYKALKHDIEKKQRTNNIEPYIKKMSNGYLKRNIERLNTARKQLMMPNQKPKKMSFQDYAELLIKTMGLLLIGFGIKDFIFPPQRKANVPSSLTDFDLDEKQLLRFISRARKIEIIPKQLNNPDKSHEGDSQPSSQERTKAGLRDYWARYEIVMTDQNGHSHTFNKYEGDPNNLLSLVEKLQKQFPKQEKAQVFFKAKKTFNFTDAMLETGRLLSPFIMVGILYKIFKGSNPDTLLKSLGQGKKDFKIKSLKNIKVRFDDVAGMEQAKKQITQFVDFLKNSQNYRKIGAKIPKGALLTGPPGTGKTMLAKACAGQSNVSFFYISGSQFVEIFVGVGASKVRDLFAKARQQAPAIIFIDEIDAIGKKRQNSRNEEKDSTLNQLLVQMDGFSSNQTVVVLAATNRKQTLDNALTRPGRFDRMVQVNLPQVKAREEIFMVHLKPLRISPDLSVRDIAKRLAQLSPGFSGADIANLCNEAAIIASRKDSPFIIQKDFQEAAQRITAGYIKKNLMNKKSRKRVAYHEAGHAVSSWFLKGGDPLVKLTIIPRSKGALGYAQYLPKSSYIKARDDLVDRVSIMLGGITSEKIFFNNMSSGGSDDLQKVYDLTRKMVTQFGMGKKTYNMTMEEQTYVQKQSMYLSDMMDDEVKQIIKQAKERCQAILKEKSSIVQKLAQTLLEKQTINSAQIQEIMGKRPSFGEQSEESEENPKAVAK